MFDSSIHDCTLLRGSVKVVSGAIDPGVEQCPAHRIARSACSVQPYISL